MGFRITQSASADAARQQVQRAFARLFTAQQAVSSGKRVSKPSDDPGSIARLLQFKERARELDRYERNAAEGRAFVDSAASFLQDVSSRIIDARENVIQGLNGTLSQSDRQTLSAAIDGILQDLVALANSKVGNRYVFGGTVTDQQPYRLVTDAAGRHRVEYSGNEDRLLAEIGPGVTSPFNVPGEAIFGAGDRGAAVIAGVTGARAGTGTDSGFGASELVVAHSLTTFGGGGVQAGASSASGDTVLGNGHSLTLTVDALGAAGTVALNGGPAIAFTNPATDLQVTGPGGEVVHLDLSGVTPGFNGTVAIAAAGTLSLDNGATTTPIDFTSANQQVIDSATGAVLAVDATGITQAGTDRVTHGSFSLFDSLIALRDGLATAGQGALTFDEDLDRLTDVLARFDDAHDRVLERLGSLGSLASRMQAAETRLGDLGVRITELISKTEDIDLSEAIIQLQQNETAYQSSLLVSSRVNQLSLLDYL